MRVRVPPSPPRLTSTKTGGPDRPPVLLFRGRPRIENHTPPDDLCRRRPLQAPHRAGQTGQPVLQHPSRAAEIQPDEALAARAEGVALVQDQPRPLDRSSCSSCPGFQPSARQSSQARNVASGRTTRICGISASTNRHRKSTFPSKYASSSFNQSLPVRVGRRDGLQAERVRLRDAAGAQGVREVASQPWIGNDGDGRLEPRQVKRLAGRRAHHRLLSEFLREGGYTVWAWPGEDQIEVDLVRDDGHAVAGGTAPPASGARRELHTRPTGLCGLHRISSLASGSFRSRSSRSMRYRPPSRRKLVEEDPASVVLDSSLKRVVDGRLNDDAVAAVGQRANEEVHGAHHAGRETPSTPPSRPSRAAAASTRWTASRIGCRSDGVAEQAVTRPVDQRFDHRLGCREFRVRDPHRQDSPPPRRRTACWSVPFERAGPPPVDGSSKVVCTLACHAYVESLSASFQRRPPRRRQNGPDHRKHRPMITPGRLSVLQRR